MRCARAMCIKSNLNTFRCHKCNSMLLVSHKTDTSYNGDGFHSDENEIFDILGEYEGTKFSPYFLSLSIYLLLLLFISFILHIFLCPLV